MRHERLRWRTVGYGVTWGRVWLELPTGTTNEEHMHSLNRHQLPMLSPATGPVHFLATSAVQDECQTHNMLGISLTACPLENDKIDD